MPRISRHPPLFPQVSAGVAALTTVLLCGCQAAPSAVSDTPITDVAASARSPLDGARLVAASVRSTPTGVGVTAFWQRGGRQLVVRDGTLVDAVAASRPTPVPAGTEIVAGLARYGETPVVAGVVEMGGRTLALVTAWQDAAGRDGSSLFRGIWASDPGSVARWTPFAVPGAEGPGITSLGAAAAELVWVTTSDGRLVVSTDGGESFSERPARPSP